MALSVEEKTARRKELNERQVPFRPPECIKTKLTKYAAHIKECRNEVITEAVRQYLKGKYIPE